MYNDRNKWSEELKMYCLYTWRVKMFKVCSDYLNMDILNPRAPTKNSLKRNVNKLIEELKRNHKNHSEEHREGSKGETKKPKEIEL